MRNITKFLMLVVLCLVGMQGNAQNVTIHPDNGSMLPSNKTGGGDSFYSWYGNATWKHEQLSLTLTTGDDNNNLTNSSNQLTSNGQLTNPANDIFASAADSNGKRYLQLGKGNGMDTYITLALPKGYRITGYTITFHRITRPNGGNTNNSASGNISFGETDNRFAYTSTTNSTANNITPYYGGIGYNYTNTYTIGRTSKTETDMSNLLYFKLSNGSANGRAYIQLDHFEITFTAEYNTPTLMPSTNVSNRSAVDIPFTTGKVDYGTFSSHSGGSNSTGYVTRVSYDGTVHDMNANLTLYEKGSVRHVDDNGFDGTAGDMVDYKAGSISSEGEYFKLESSKHPKYNDDGEAIYYIETPIWATNSSSSTANKNPIGYRIVGAKFDYAAGTSTTYIPATFKIEYESTGHGPDEDGIYGLNTHSKVYNWTPKYHTVWRIDEEGYIYGYDEGILLYLSVNGTSVDMVTTKPSADAGTFEVVNNQIRRINYPTQYIGWQETVKTVTDEEGNTTEVTYEDEEGHVWTRMNRVPVIVTDEDYRSDYNQQSAAGGGSHGKYTFKIYDNVGVDPVETIEVDGEGGSVDVYGYNNDAIKISVVGTGLIKGTLILQALDPYIDHIDIVCQEDGGNGGKLTQQFNATDFSVRGGKFTFYVPEDFKAPAKFTFDNLYSHYGDETYYGETSSTDHARYFFVGSTYGDSEDNVYERDSTADYKTKIKCLQPGNKKYLFNNAATASNTAGGQFEEYPFSKALYQSKVSGSFSDFQFTQAEMANNAAPKTAYLFTCDETRYNIAPTTATQHVYYAFYEMEIDMRKKDYRPNLAWTKVYDETFYDHDEEIPNSMWGLKVTTDQVIDDQGTHSGYVTVSQLLDVIEHGLDATSTQAGVQGLDSNDEYAPKSMSQILYIDGHELMNIVENQTTASGTTTTHSLNDIITQLGTNALIYLPYGSTPSSNNVAYNTVAGYQSTPIFRSASNIVLTDKQPFYAPFNIQVVGDNYATYTRLITAGNGQVQNATLMLPFGLSVVSETVDDKTQTIHTNDDGSCTFSINELKAAQAKVDPGETGVDYGISYFGPITPNENGMSEANVPYMVKVDEESSASIEGEDFSFVAKQKGATIVQTPAVNFVQRLAAVKTMGSVDFINESTYSGKTYPRTANVFYFAKNMFLNIHTLVDYKPTLYVYPFRSVYTYEGNLANKLNWLEISYDEDTADGIKPMSMPANADLMIRSGNGMLEMEALRGQTVTVRSLAGTTVNTVSLNAGDSKTINLPSGVYIVNNVKIIVK